MRSLANNPRTNASTTRTLSGQDATATSATDAASAMEVRTILRGGGNAILFGASNRRITKFLEITRSNASRRCEREAEGDLVVTSPRSKPFGFGSPAVS